MAPPNLRYLKDVCSEVELYETEGGRRPLLVILACLESTGRWFWNATTGTTFNGCAFGLLDDMGFSPTVKGSQRTRKVKVMFGEPVEGMETKPTPDELAARLRVDRLIPVR